MRLHTEYARSTARAVPSSLAITENPSPGPLSDEEVVDRVLQGDLASFEIIMRRYNQRLYRVVRSVLGNDADVEDVMQETYLRAFRHLGQFERRAMFSTWLSRIAVHEALARRRQRQRMRPLEATFLERMHMHTLQRQLDGERAAGMREFNDALVAAVDQLPEDLRTVFMLRVIEELDTAEVAACLGLTESNVKVRLHRARAMLQRRLDESVGADFRRMHQFDGARCDRIVRAVLSRLVNADSTPDR